MTYSKPTKNLVCLLRYKCCVIYKIRILKGITNQKILERFDSLNSFIGSCGVLRIGVGLEKSTLYESVTHPIILSKRGKVTELLISWCHQKTPHSGRNITLNKIRSSEYWVMQRKSAVKKFISRCVTGRRLRQRVGELIMADLPHNRLKEEPHLLIVVWTYLVHVSSRKEETH